VHNSRIKYYNAMVQGADFTASDGVVSFAV